MKRLVEKKSNEGRAVARARATLMDVVRESGTSKATVSRVLNNRPGVMESVRKRVQQVIKRLHYTPVAAARALSLAKSNTLGLVFQDITSGWTLNVFRGIMHVASGTGYSVVTALSTLPGDEHLLPSRLMAEGRVDGLVCYDPRLAPDVIDSIKMQGIPFVLIQKQCKDPDVNTVCIENIRGAHLAMQHLLQLGYRRILLLTGGDEHEDSIERLNGVYQALQEFRLKPSSVGRLNGHCVGIHAVNALRAHLDQKKRLPEAIFAFNDNMALAVMQWLKSKGVRVPEEVAVVGFDGVEESEFAGLTTVANPMYETGVLAAQILLDMVSHSNESRKARQVLLSGHLVVRESCGAKLKQGARPQGPS